MLQTNHTDNFSFLAEHSYELIHLKPNYQTFLTSKTNDADKT